MGMCLIGSLLGLLESRYAAASSAPCGSLDALTRRDEIQGKRKS